MIRKGLSENKMIAEETYKAMYSECTSKSIICAFFKIHKLNHPERPRVSCIGTPTEKILAIVDYVHSPFMA